MPTTTPFNNLITFSRGSNATVTGSNGLIQWAPNNLLTFSEQFDNAAWGKTGLGTGSAPVVTPNVAVAPDGTTTADLVAFNRGAGNAIGDRSTLSQLPTILNGYAYAATIYVKAATAGDIGKQLAYRGVAGVGYQVITLTADWVRITTVETSTGTAGNFELASRGTVSADNQVSAHVWGAQLELGSTATTYNPTTVKNLLGFSEAFDNAAWTKSRASIVTGAQANPINGLFNAQKLMENTENNYHYLVRGSLGVTAGTYTLSIYAKAAERSRILLYFGPTNKGRAFDLAAGTTYQQSGVPDPDAYSIVSLGGGWYRCSITVNSATPTTAEIYLVSGAAFSYTGDGNSGVYIYGAQLSDSASLDPYVPTPGAAPSSTAFYGPRFDFDPVTLQPRGLLVEEQRTNLLLYSERFDDAIWVKGLGGAGSVAVVTPNTATAPDGTLSADRLQLNAGGTALADFSFVQQSVTGLANPHSAARTVWMKSNTGLSYQIAIRELGANTFSVVTVGPNWSRFEYSTSGVAAVGDGLQIIVRGTYGTSTAADILVWGAQLEAGAFATSYIPTVASTVTRSADVATISGSLFSQWYRQDEGCLVVEASNPANGVLYILDANNSTVNEEIRLATTSTSGSLVVWQAGAVQANITVGSMTANAPFKMAAGYAANNTNAALNGTVGTADTSFVSPTVSRLQIGASFTQYLNGHIRNIRFIPARAADFQLQGLST